MHDSAEAVGRTEMGLQFPRRGREPHGMILGETSAQVVTNLLDVDTLFDASWFHSDAAGGMRPNVLIQCPSAHIPVLVERLSAKAEPPLHTAVVPGPLPLPAGSRGTLVIHDMSRLTVAQQISLYDWMTARTGTMQVIAITTEPLAPKIERGQFLQALYTRLNVVQAIARRGGDQP